jgi:transcriptional regulator with XRE-family HTH domain
LPYVFDKQAFAKRLAEIEKTAGTRKAFSERIHIQSNTLKSYIEGRAIPNAETLAYIAAEYDVSLYWLLTGRGDMNRDPNDSTRDPRERLLDKAVTLLREHGGSDAEIREAVRLILAGGDTQSGQQAIEEIA